MKYPFHWVCIKVGLYGWCSITSYPFDSKNMTEIYESSNTPLPIQEYKIIFHNWINRKLSKKEMQANEEDPLNFITTASVFTRFCSFGKATAIIDKIIKRVLTSA